MTRELQMGLFRVLSLSGSSALQWRSLVLTFLWRLSSPVLTSLVFFYSFLLTAALKECNKVPEYVIQNAFFKNNKQHCTLNILHVLNFTFNFHYPFLKISIPNIH